MTACTDDERRRVARRLRGLSDDSTYPDLIGAIADQDGWCAAADAADRLADLIEPPTQCPYYHSDRHHCSAYDDVVDREALLALAEEMELSATRLRNLAGESASFGFLSRGLTEAEAEGFARRIREALGVER